jgi:DNA-directed RNA polymerase specialized sigma54-like protein
MKPSLQFRLSQHLTLTPQLQQSIRLLQLSTVELNQEIERLLMDNPVLEREDAAAPVRPKANGRSTSPAAGAAAARTTRTATEASPPPTRRRCASICARSYRSPTSPAATACSCSC